MPAKLEREVRQLLAAMERKRIVEAGAALRAAARTGRERNFIQDDKGRGAR